MCGMCRVITLEERAHFMNSLAEIQAQHEVLLTMMALSLPV